MSPFNIKSAALSLLALAFTSMPYVDAYDANHGEDSRLIAYVGNWLQCPTDDQVDAYSHIVIAFASSSTWVAEGQPNICNQQCQVPSLLTCGGQVRPDLIQKWRNMGKKVIVSFGGAGMGGSWDGDKNNCWDYCFGREDQLSTALVNIVKDQNLDGIDIDYEYCYDVAGRQAGSCAQRSSLYSDAKAQRFLNSLTSSLRTKLDILRAGNGYNRGRYELTHAPMDSDLARDSKYFGILRERRADLDFLMPQFYNGVTRAGKDGFDGSGAGQIKASTIYSSLANELFDREPNKIVFGHCISDCSTQLSNVNANQAVQIQKQIKAYNNGEFQCNGGAFFWVSSDDVGGAWSDQVVREVSLTAGCSKSQPTPTNPPGPIPTPPTGPSPPSPSPPGATCGSGNRGNGICADGTCCSQFGWCGTSTAHCSGGGGGGSPPSPTPTGTCGNGNRGNGICADGTCCSQFGWCGTSAAHCSGGGGSPPSPTPTGTCGNGNRGNGICADGTCCSQFGWCGTSAAHCSGGGGGGSPPSPTPTGTCGNGNRGNGICADGKCCSKFGWCGTSAEHCSGGGRMLRGNNNNTTETQPEVETEVEVSVGDLIDKPN